MSPEDQLLFESRSQTRQMIVAGAAGVLLMVASIVGLTGAHATVEESTIALITQHQRATIDIVESVINAIAEVALASTLIYLWRCASARAERRQLFVPILAVIGTVLAVIAGIAYAFEITSKANEFVTTGTQTYDEANRLTSGAALLILQVGAQLASLLVAIAFVLISLQAMRVGLLPRFLAYVGMVAGALVLFPVIAVPIVQLYWLLAVAFLISGRWPSGLPPAWRSGRAEAWPSSAEMRARRIAAAEANRESRATRRRGGSRDAAGDAPDAGAAGGTPAAGTADAGATGAGSRTRSTTPKRKRKRRH
jgi:hypothetical protein